jgi:hypothetical protein
MLSAHRAQRQLQRLRRGPVRIDEDSGDGHPITQNELRAAFNPGVG